MRAVKLAKVAAQSEKLRLQALAQRQARRGACLLVALVFAVGALALGHVVAFLAIVPALGAQWTSVLLLGFDLLAALVPGAIGAMSKPGEVEVEAQRLGQLALRQMRQDLTVAALVPRSACSSARSGRVAARLSPPSYRGCCGVGWPSSFSR